MVERYAIATCVFGWEALPPAWNGKFPKDTRLVRSVTGVCAGDGILTLLLLISAARYYLSPTVVLVQRSTRRGRFAHACEVHDLDDSLFAVLGPGG